MRRYKWSDLLGAFALVLAASVSVPVCAKPPERIVSLTVCTDQLLLDLVPRERIAAVSYLATDPTLSLKVEEARALKGVRGLAEEVLALDPDLVIAQEYSTTATVSLLQRLGYRVVLVPLATDFESMRRGIRIIGKAVGEEAHAEELIADFDKQRAAAAPHGPERPTAVAYQVNSLASGPGSLIDAALQAAGFHNVAGDRPLGPGGRLPLEVIVADPPDLVVLANAPDTFRSTVGDNLRHPAFAYVIANRPHMQIAMPLWLCATPQIAEAVRELGAMRRALLKSGDKHE